MYHFKELDNYNQHFWFDKDHIDNMNWAILPAASKSVYPVIASHCNADGLAFPGEDTIATLSGISPKTARKGIAGLGGFPGICIEPYTTKTGRQSKRYKIDSPPRRPGRAFPFFKTTILGGNWMKLNQTARALYIVMRKFGYFDHESLVYDGGDGSEIQTDEDFLDIYKDRKFDFCNAEINLLSKYAGITRQSFYPAMKSLQKCALAEKTDSMDEPMWKIFLRPKGYYNVAYLNRISNKKFTRKNDV
jgi:hypothetical protein